MDLNVKSVFYTAQKFAPLLEKNASTENPSRIVVTGSVAGLVPGTLGAQGTYAYSASKAAVIHLAKNMAVELGPRGIITNAVAPGFYPSKLASGLIEMQGKSSFTEPIHCSQRHVLRFTLGGAKKMAEQSPNRRLGTPEDIAGLVVFLSSRASRHLNGAVIATDGGAMLAANKL